MSAHRASEHGAPRCVMGVTTVYDTPGIPWTVIYCQVCGSRMSTTFDGDWEAVWNEHVAEVALEEHA